MRQTCIVPVIEDIMALDYYVEDKVNTGRAVGASGSAAAEPELPLLSGWLRGGIVVAGERRSTAVRM